MGFYYDPTYFLVIIAFLLTTAASLYMKSTFSKYQQIDAKINISAADTAIRIMQYAGIDNVKVGRVAGDLTDHYAPTKKELNLSDTTCSSRSIASIGVAAHEVGHAIQDHQKYPLLVFQMGIAPALSIVSNISVPLIIVGLILGWMGLFQIGIIAFSATLVYQLITLPIEFDASSRALKNLEALNILDANELYGARKVLTAAALTYVAAAASTLLQLLRFIMIFNNSRRD